MTTHHLGIDIGSTTVKVVVTDQFGEQIYSMYERHNARQAETLLRVLRAVERDFPTFAVKAAVCGSGGRVLAHSVGLPFVQEVVANAAAVSRLYTTVNTAVELGGQDAKVIFFRQNEHGKLVANDMRMNGSCAGGTGAFIDEIAALLQCPPDEFNALAEAGTQVYDISGRCGVFAKTDIQPLLLQGAKREDIALSTFHAIAKQTIGGLSQGLELRPPIIFEGGPLTFNPQLIKVFAERLNLRDEEIILPEHPETIVAFGTAMAIEQLFPDTTPMLISEIAEKLQQYMLEVNQEDDSDAAPLFRSDSEKETFTQRHQQEMKTVEEMTATGEKKTIDGYIGIDSGSTTSKFVLLNKKNEVIYRFYANNFGKPLDVLKQGLLEMHGHFAEKGIELNIKAFGTTGYGEKITAAAFGADYHTVETIAHTRGCLQFVPDASFILDIGGQDMKAIWVRDGVITNIMLNEACSSGCGSFLENFADTLGIPVQEIADHAFCSAVPAHLGSRCTVFMTSTIINEQRRGKNEDDIMAGLCRSIVENVFTKVIRLNNLKSLGNRIVVQGGTFRNAAVLRAFEEYVGQEVTLAPYPGEMGALGVALLAKENACDRDDVCTVSTFIGFDAIEHFDYHTDTKLHCGKCENNCALTVTRFSNGKFWTTGNRCERGISDSRDGARTASTTTNLFALRNQLLFKTYPYEIVSPPKNQIIGIPLVLEFWDSLPFWTTFFRALGYQVKISHPSSRKNYEAGLPYVASDTICFPAKLVHGHIIDLVEQGVDTIFMPYVMHFPPEGKDKLSPYVCSVVQGYPMVTRHSQDPESRYGVHFETPVFHFFTEKDRPAQIIRYAINLQRNAYGIAYEKAQLAYQQAESALLTFRRELREAGAKLLNELKSAGKFGVVLAGRPYQCDPMVNHRIYDFFLRQGIAVFTVDSLPDLEKVDLSHTRVEITNNYHTRMLAAAVLAAQTPELEYAQIVSFGCGHDAILSDEIVRIMDDIAQKPPLILKVDESDASGSIGIRVQSFVESVAIRRNRLQTGEIRELETAFPVKYTPKDKKLRTILVPNISKEVSTLLCAIFEKHGFLVKGLPIGGVGQIRVGKQYSHNDICFPCQMVIGELIDALRKGNYNQDEVAVGMVKFQCDCRMSHYAALLRKALDAAGYDRVPVITTDPNDTKKSHPGVHLLGIRSVLEAVTVFMMLDILVELSRKIRPYEMEKGSTSRMLSDCTQRLATAISKGLRAAYEEFERCIRDFGELRYDRAHLKPRVFVTGELLVTYHPGSNFHIEEYLEGNGMETVFPRVTDQLRKDFLASMAEIRDFKANIPKYPFVVTKLFDYVQKKLEKTAVQHPLYVPATKPADLYKGVAHIIPETLSCGEGWLMAAEIAHYAKEDVKRFVILQPFGCIPNHICGRGTIRALKNDFPDISILPLDLDPDTSYANVENRLQMLIMNTVVDSDL